MSAFENLPSEQESTPKIQVPIAPSLFEKLKSNWSIVIASVFGCIILFGGIIYVIYSYGIRTQKPQPTPTPQSEIPTPDLKVQLDLKSGNLVGFTKAFPEKGTYEYTIADAKGNEFHTGLGRAFDLSSTAIFNVALNPNSSKVIVEGGFVKDNSPTQQQNGSIIKKIFPLVFAARGDSPIVDGLYLVDLKAQTVSKIPGPNPAGLGIAWGINKERSVILYIDKDCEYVISSDTKPSSKCLVMIDGETFDEVCRFNVWYQENSSEENKVFKNGKPRLFVDNKRKLLMEGSGVIILFDIESGKVDVYREQYDDMAKKDELTRSLPADMQEWYTGRLYEDLRNYLQQFSLDGVYKIEGDDVKEKFNIIDRENNTLIKTFQGVGPNWLGK